MIKFIRGKGSHVYVFFTNGTMTCSCSKDVGTNFNEHPNLRTEIS